MIPIEDADSAGIQLLIFNFRAVQLPPFEVEHMFHVERRWRFDIAWPEIKLFVEYEGLKGGPEAGRSGHQSLEGYKQDLDKYNAAALAGWWGLRFSYECTKTGKATEMTVRMHLRLRGGDPGDYVWTEQYRRVL